MIRAVAREARDLFLGPVEGDTYERVVPRACSFVLALIPAIAYVVRGFL